MATNENKTVLSEGKGSWDYKLNCLGNAFVINTETELNLVSRV